MTLWLSSLSLSNFRNYDSLKLSLSAEPVVFVGHNGAGKTNLLEAVSFLTPGRGIRRAVISEVQKQGSASPWAVAAEVHLGGNIVDIGTARDADASGEKRIVHIDGKNARNQNELAKYVSALWLTPQMDSLFLENDSVRRKFLDRLVFTFEPDHAGRVHDYEFAMRERSKLLQMPHYDAKWVGALEQEMAEFGIAIAIARRTMVEHLNQSINASGFSFPKARITLDGFVEEALNKGTPAVRVEDQAREKLKMSRAADAASGRCTFGLHRTNMQSWYDAKNMQAQNCSTGEQKALLLSIVLGQTQAVKQWKGIAPILLLDEVVSHLDSGRRAELCEMLLSLGSQCWMTGTDMVFFEGLGTRGQRFTVSDGKARKSA